MYVLMSASHPPHTWPGDFTAANGIHWRMSLSLLAMLPASQAVLDKLKVLNARTGASCFKCLVVFFVCVLGNTAILVDTGLFRT